MIDALDTEDEAPASDPNKQYGDVVETAFLLDTTKADDPTVCKTLHRIWSDQKEKYARYVVECEVNERRRGGECNIWVQKTQDQARYIVYRPAGSLVLLDQFGQKADRLCQRFVSQLSQDPAQPNAVPSTGEDEDRDAADFMTQILKEVCSESGLDDNEAHKLAQDYACSHGSGWVWYYTDPMGGGRQPVEVDAHPMAQHVDTAMQDPMTGMDLDPQQVKPVLKFVGEDGTLSDDKASASLRWVPKVTRQVIPGMHVRLWPFTAQDVWDADGLLYFDYQPVSVAKEWFPDLKEMTEEEWKEATDFRLTDAQHLLPKKGGKAHDPKPEGRMEDWLVLIACFWAPEGSTYPDGAYIACIGDKKVAHRDSWTLQNEDGSRERRDIPWTQVRQFRGTREHPQGKPLMSFIGSGSEMLAGTMGRFEELSDMAANRKIFLPFGSTIQPHEIQDPTNSVLYFQPGYKPEYEQVPEPPQSLKEMVQYIQDDLADGSSLQQAGQGLETPDAQSGRAKLAVIAQVNAGLSDVLQNQNRARVRGWRIIGQEIRANYTVPQMTRVTGADGSYKVERWTRSDLGSTKDVEIAKGSGTMLSPTQKVQQLAELQQFGGLDPEDFQELVSTGLDPMIGLKDNRFLQRIRRQIMEWEKGPPEGWMPPQQELDPLTGAPKAGPPTIGLDGIPVPGAPLPPPPDPILAQMWEPVESDMSPLGAKWRIRELARCQQSTRYLKLPPEWRLPVVMEYQRMIAALAPPPMPIPGGPPPEGGGDPSKPGLSPTEQQMAGGPPQ